MWGKQMYNVSKSEEGGIFLLSDHIFDWVQSYNVNEKLGPSQFVLCI